MSNRTRHLNNKVRCLGAEFETNRSGKCKVIEYINFHNIIVEFENPKFVVKTSLQCLKTGKVFNQLTPILSTRVWLVLGIIPQQMKGSTIFGQVC